MTATNDPLDVLITGARVIDGTGNPWFHGDVALAGERIAAITPAGLIPPERAREVVAGGGMVVCPGFIDIQSHSIVPFLTDRRSLSKVTQGVTTEILGEAWTPAPFGGRISRPFPEGLPIRIGEESATDWDALGRTWARFGDWLADLARRGVSVNVGSFIGGGTVREFGKGYDLGDATPDELHTMRDVVEAAMQDGAFGLATALIYPPGQFAGTEELVALCEIVAKYRGVHITHVRSEEARLLDGIEEAITIAKRTGVVTEIYHLKAAGEANWHLMASAMARIDAARAEGIDITADMYPYTAAGTGLAACLPPWAAENDTLFANLRDPAFRARVKAEMLSPAGDWEDLAGSTGGGSVTLAGLVKPAHRAYIGRSLAEVAAERGEDWADTAIALLVAEEQNVFCFFHMMTDKNLRRQLQQPWMKISTDAGGIDPERWTLPGLNHPRGFGTYPRVLGYYVREQGVIPLEDAIRKMTSAVADRLFLRDRGLLRAGCYADVVLFDPATVADRATFRDPHQLSTGIRDVWVNGARVLHDGVHTGATPGHRLSGPGAVS
ncbi:MAG: D-aminoacylase [Chloroflexota bacterium]|nr:D-aminoacylase [Chloroflexota bacterium]